MGDSDGRPTFVILRAAKYAKDNRLGPAEPSTTAFEFAHSSDMWMQQLAGWIGLDSFDERNPVGQAFLWATAIVGGVLAAFFLLSVLVGGR